MAADSMVTREDIRTALRAAFEPLDYVHAMWEAGASAFGRIDEWSDIDLQIIVDDERVADAVAVAERAMVSLSGIDLKYEIPQPAWHGHWQAFYRLERTVPYLLVDFVVMKSSTPNKFLEREIHGEPMVHFDKRNALQCPPLDAAAFAGKLRSRIESLRVTSDMFHILTLKELNRGNDIEAVSFYHGHVLRPLVEALRIRYAPARYNFHTRYVYYDLPADVTERLEHFFFPASALDIRGLCDEAAEWMTATLDGIDMSEVEGLIWAGE